MKSFAHGRQLDVSSFNGSGQCEVRFDEKLTQMTLVPITGQGEWSVPLICVIDAKVDSPPGLGRYSLNASVRLRVGPHSGRGPDTLLFPRISSLFLFCFFGVPFVFHEPGKQYGYGSKMRTQNGLPW